MKQTSVPDRREFEITLKCKALQNWLNSGESAAVAREKSGSNANLVYAWRKLVPAVAGGKAVFRTGS